MEIKTLLHIYICNKTYFQISHLVIGVAICILSHSCNVTPSSEKQNVTQLEAPYELKGKIHNTNEGILKIYALVAGTPTLVIDSVFIKKGEFSLKGITNKTTPVGLSFNNTSFIGPIFLEKGQIVVDWKLNSPSETSSDTDQYTVTGTTSNEAYQAYRENIETLKQGHTNKELKAIISKIDLLDTVKDSTILNFLAKEVRILTKKIDIMVTQARKAHTLKNCSSFVGPYILAEAGSGFNQDVFSITEMKTVFNALDPALATLENYKFCKEELERALLLSPGKQAPDFHFTYGNGEELSLSKMRGSLVLLEFWAYWSAPCLTKFPSLIQLQEAYKNEEFQILTIHDNAAKDIFLKAHKALKLPGKAVYVADGTAFSIWDAYNVNSLPTSYLIGKDGNLLARNPSKEIIEKYIKTHK